MFVSELVFFFYPKTFSILSNLVEISIPKKFSVCIFMFSIILILCFCKALAFLWVDGRRCRLRGKSGVHLMSLLWLFLRIIEIYGNRLIPTPIHTIKSTGRLNIKGSSQDILNTLSEYILYKLNKLFRLQTNAAHISATCFICFLLCLQSVRRTCNVLYLL